MPGLPGLNPVALLFPDDPLAAIVVEAELVGLGAVVRAVHAEFPGGLPPWFVHPDDAGSERQLRALGGAHAGLVPFLPPPESVTVVLTEAGGRVVSGDGSSLAQAFGSALRACASPPVAAEG